MNSISLVGNLTGDPKLIFGDSGKARATFSVAVNEGQGETEKTHFVNVTAFGTLAENIADSLSKGQRVVVVGRLNTYSKDVTIDGDDKSLTMVSFTASAIGPDLRWAVRETPPPTGTLVPRRPSSPRSLRPRPPPLTTTSSRHQS